VICGGAALLAAGLVLRTTRDVDIVALMDDQCSSTPRPFPGILVHAAQEVADNLGDTNSTRH